MPRYITELTFLKNFASRYGIPAPRFLSDTLDIAPLKSALQSWGGQAFVKPDVASGKRGKAGLITPVSTARNAMSEMKRISGLELEGKLVRTAYLVEKIPAQMEVYTAITYNTSSLAPSLTVSLKGGIDIEEIPQEEKITTPVDVYRGLDAYQAGEILSRLDYPQEWISTLSRAMIAFWDLFISSGMQFAEINPWRINAAGQAVACDFKAIIDETNYKSKIPGINVPEYSAQASELEEEMAAWNQSSHQGQAHVSELGGAKILPILFGGGASTIITETLMLAGGSPMFLSDFGGNPPYERMLGTAMRCFKYKLADARLLLILGGKANNTYIDVTFQAIADALITYTEENGPVDIPVIIGRGGPRLVKGLLTMKRALEYLGLPYVIFGPDTPVTLVAEYAAKIVSAMEEIAANARGARQESQKPAEIGADGSGFK